MPVAQCGCSGQSCFARVQAARHQDRLRNKASKTATSYPPFNIICLASLQTNRLRASSGPSQICISKIRSNQTSFFCTRPAIRFCQRHASHPSVLPRSAVCLPWQALQLWSKRKASVASSECCFVCNTRTKLTMHATPAQCVATVGCLPAVARALQLWSQRMASVASGMCCFACNTSCHGSSFSQFLVITSSGAQRHLQIHFFSRTSASVSASHCGASRASPGHQHLTSTNMEFLIYGI